MAKESNDWIYTPDEGWIFGQAWVSKLAGYRSPHYFIEKSRKDPTAAFIRALGVDFDVSVNSVPPGKDFLVFSIPASLQAWGDRVRETRAARRDTGGLIRWVARPTDVTSGVNL